MSVEMNFYTELWKKKKHTRGAAGAGEGTSDAPAPGSKISILNKKTEYLLTTNFKSFSQIKGKWINNSDFF
jgi:hypothetical protein